MISLAEAWRLLEETIQPAAPAQLLLMEAAGCVLAEAVVSTQDSPPFDKALMDGYAIRSGDWGAGIRGYLLLGEVTAGQVWRGPELARSQTIRIMTGAPLPPGADAVLRVEDATPVVNTAGEMTIQFPDRIAVQTELNLARRGTAMRIGEALLTPGQRLRPMEIGLLAELGRAQVRVQRPPRVAVLATGDELVPLGEPLGPGQIHNSNEPMLCVQIRAAGGIPVPLGIARDNIASLREKIGQGLQADLLCLSGGVSAGKLDLVPAELQQAGVREVFHKVELKPGKPIWFGLSASEPRRYVFGLPGNPVSSLVCFELFVRPAIRRWQGIEPALPQLQHLPLAGDFDSTSDRPTFYPGRLLHTAAGRTATPVSWQGSFDLRATVNADLLVFFSEQRRFSTGEPVLVVPLPS